MEFKQKLRGTRRFALKMMNSQQRSMSHSLHKGFVERISSEGIEGWVAVPETCTDFEIRLGDARERISARRVERADVKKAHPDTTLKAGFILPVTPQLLESISEEVSVEVEGKAIPLSVDLLSALQAGTSKRWLPLRRGNRVSRLMNLETSAKRAISTSEATESDRPVVTQEGMAFRVDLENARAGRTMRLETAGHEFALALTPIESEGAPRAAYADIPGVVWETTGQDGQVPVSIRIDGAPTPVKLKLDAMKAYQALEWRAMQSSGQQPEVLLAVEHARYLAKGVPFSSQLRSWLTQEAERFGCLDYLVEFFPEAAQEQGNRETPQDDDATLRFNEAYASFFDNLGDWQGREAALVTHVAEQFQLAKEQEFDLIECLVAQFCREQRFESIANLLPDYRIDAMRNADTAWGVTNALPFVAYRGEAVDAADLLRGAAAKPGWFNTECVLEASRYIRDLPGSSNTKVPFVYALIDLIRRQSTDYWSRAHDVHLARSLAVWLTELEYLPRWLASDLEQIAVQAFGMSLALWDALADVPLTTQLREAKVHFENLEPLQNGPIDAGHFLKIHSAIQFFRRFDSKDAEMAAQEILVASNRWFRNAAEVRTFVQEAYRGGEDQAILRHAAHPDTPDEERSKDEVFRLTEVIRRIANTDQYGQKSLSIFQPAELRAGRLLMEIAGQKSDDVTVALCQLETLSEELNRPEAGWLSADILSRAAELLEARGEDGAYFSRLAESEVLEAASRDGASLRSPATAAAISRLVRQRGTRLNSPGGHRGVFPAIRRVLHGHDESSLRMLEAQAAPPSKGASLEAKGHDTLVVVYSCRKYLDTRIATIRETWVQDLKNRDIPYVVLVGDGDDTLDGDVLRLKVDDTYEALPEKTLHMVKWVYENTDFNYLIKIDDDCYFSVDNYFDALTYRKFHYYGKALTKSEGAMSRTWHQEKSSKKIARHSLDRSPEPSRYCDGGSAYSLSRHAMGVICREMETTQGRWLRSVSYMEDKLVGDMLSHADISPCNEGYIVQCYRKTHSGSMVVSQNDNAFDVSEVSPTHIVHLDGDDRMSTLEENSKGRTLFPKRIWPSCAGVRLDWNGNQLELLSPIDRLTRVETSRHVVVAAMRSEMTMLPHFLRHYRSIGIEAFLIVDNLSDDGTREHLLEQDDVLLYSVNSEYSASHYGVAWQQALLANHCLGKWALLVDADEFLIYPGISERSIADVTQDLDAQSFTCAGTWLVDMYPKGPLKDCDFKKVAPFEAALWHDSPPVKPVPGGGFYSNTKISVTSALRHRLSPGLQPTLFMANKFPLIKYAPWVRLSEGIHFTGNVRIASEFLTLAHFKYHSGFAEKVETEIRRKQHFSGAVEYRRYKMMIEEAQGVMYDKSISTKLDLSSIGSIFGPARIQKAKS